MMAFILMLAAAPSSLLLLLLTRHYVQCITSLPTKPDVFFSRHGRGKEREKGEGVEFEE